MTKLELCFKQNVPVAAAIEFAADMIAGAGTFAYLASITFYAIIATGYSERSVRCFLSGKASETKEFAEVALAFEGICYEQ